MTEEFSADQTEIPFLCYPIETVTKFDLKSIEAEGWIDHTGIDYLIRRNCIISLALPLSTSAPSSLSAGQAALPADVEQAAVEQVSAWFQNHDKLGLTRNRPHQGTYQQFSQMEHLPSVATTLKHYQR